MDSFKKLFRKLVDRLLRKSCFVILDSRDNSVTFSKRLYKISGIEKMEKAKVFCFFVPSTGHYAFCFNPEFKQETHLANVMYNVKYRCIGFECLVPTVNRIFYDYGLPAIDKAKLSVVVRKMEDPTLTYYQICKPDEYGQY